MMRDGNLTDGIGLSTAKNPKRPKGLFALIMEVRSRRVRA